MRPNGPPFYVGRAKCRRAGRGSGSDMRTASDSLYDDLQQFGTSRGTRSRFSNAVRRAGSLETCGFKQRFWSLLGLRPKATRARGARNSPRRRERSERRQWRMQGGERVAAVKISSVRRQAAQKFWAPQQCTFSNINRGRRPLRGASIELRRKMRTGCGAKKARSAIDRTRCAIGVGGGESRRCHSAGTK